MKKKSSQDWKYLPVNPKHKAKIDSSDFAKASAHTWRVIKTASGRMRVVTNIRQGKRNRQITLGWFLMRPPKGKMVYPRRFVEGFDYRKSNLIVCTMKERQRILPKSRNHGTSLYKGVSFDASKKRWRAGIQYNKKTVFIGLFKSEGEAAMAYNQAAKKYFGEESYQNQVKKTVKRRKSEGES